MASEAAGPLQKDPDLLRDSVELPTIQKMMDELARTLGIGAGLFDASCERIGAPANRSRFCKLIKDGTKGGRKCGEEECRRYERRNFPRDGITKGPWKCHAGILDFAVPIVTSKRVLIGAIYGAQVLDPPLTRNDLGRFAEVAKKYGVNELDLIYAAIDLTRMKRPRLQEVITLTEAIARLIADLVEKREEERRFLVKLTGSLPLDERAEWAIEYVQKAVGAEGCSMFFKENVRGKDALVLKYTSSPVLRAKEKREGPLYYSRGEGLTGSFLGSNGASSLNIKNIRDPDELRPLGLTWANKHSEVEDPDQVCSYLGVPLLADGEVIGVIRANRSTELVEGKGPFNDEHLKTVEGLAKLIVNAIQSARESERAERGKREADALSDAARALNSQPGLKEILDAIIRSGLEVVSHGAIDVSLYVLRHDPDAQEFVVIDGDGEAGSGFQPEHVGRRFPHNQGLAGVVLREGRSHLSAHVHEDPDYLKEPIVENLESAVVVPIKQGEKVIGTLSMCSPHEYAFSEEDKTLLERFADHVIVALDNAYTYERDQAEIEQLDTLHKWVHKQPAPPRFDDISPLCQGIVDKAKTRLQALACSLFLLKPDGRLHLEATTDAELREKASKKLVFYKIGEGITGSVALRRDVLRMNDVGDPNERKRKSSPGVTLKHEKKHPEGVLKMDAEWKAFLGAPIRFMDDLIGVIRLSQKQDSLTFLPEDEEVLRRLTERVAASLRFAQTLAKLQKLMRAKEITIQTFAHDAGDPVQQLFGEFRQFYSDQTPRVRENLETIYALVEHIAFLVETHVLVGGGDEVPPSPPESFKLRTTAARAIDVASLTTPFGQTVGRISIQNRIDTRLTVCGYRAKLHIILYNLLANAIAAEPEEQITVSAKRRDNSVHIRVTDDGVGCVCSVMPDQPSDDHAGLYIVGKLVDAYGGAVRLDRRPKGKRGTVAIVTLPQLSLAK